MQQSMAQKIPSTGNLVSISKALSSKHGNGIVIAFADSSKQKVTLSTTLTKPDNSTKYVGSFQVCEASDEELQSIQCQVSL